MKKRILLVTKFYYRRGGDCVHVLELERLLRRCGHEVAVFAMDHPLNIPSEGPLFTAPRVSFDHGGITARMRAAMRVFGLGSVRAAAARALDEFRPDVVHLHNVHSYLSPVVGLMARKRGLRVVWTLHDYKLCCPAYTCMHLGHRCTACFTDPWQVVTRRCLKDSLAASLLGALEARRWHPRLLCRIADAFVCPSRFMAATMEAAGFDRDRLNVIHNFATPATGHELDPLRSLPTDLGQYYCYVGRLSSEKGVRTLMRAASRLPHTLCVAGTGPLADELMRDFGRSPSIRFLGQLPTPLVRHLLSQARFSVMPSECNDNNPLAVIESLSVGTPVVATRVGGIPELITPADGILVAPADASALSLAIMRAWTTSWSRHDISAAATRFSPASYYSGLLPLY